jgi:hypothetical protein
MNANTKAGMVEVERLIREAYAAGGPKWRQAKRAVRRFIRGARKGGSR